ncbi:MAG: class I SAM-dependent methyltransferase [Gammaproteobacteria bacterium]
MTIRVLLLGVLALGLASQVTADSMLDAETLSRLESALASDIRTDAEKDRDANRKPVETLAFFGLKHDMRVLELFPGSGWYTKLLGPVLRDHGTLYVALRTGRIREIIAATAELDRVEVLDVNPDMPMTETRGVFELDELSFFEEDLDLVVTFRNAHNLTPGGRHNLNLAVFETLKPGGLYGVIDHTRRHMEPDNAVNMRRADPVRIIHECEAAGFEFVAFSDLHYRPVDGLDKEVGDASVTGRTDRFTLLFRKPPQ